MIEWKLNLQIVSPNRQEHWTARHKRNKRNKRLLWAHWVSSNTKPQPPCIVRIQRCFCSKSKEMDSDNMISASKNLRDCIADLLIPGLPPGRADGDKRITWQYSQASAKYNCIRILIEEI